jgi:CBS domain containing-hemolysin-like protein
MSCGRRWERADSPGQYRPRSRGRRADHRRHGLTSALELERLTIGDIVSRTGRLSTVAADADAAEIQKQSRTPQHRRILVRGDHHTILGVIHVRDTLRVDAGSKAGDQMGPVLRLPSDTPVYRALHIMRQTRNHLAMVTAGDDLIGLITLTDVLQRLLPDAASAA